MFVCVHAQSTRQCCIVYQVRSMFWAAVVLTLFCNFPFTHTHALLTTFYLSNSTSYHNYQLKENISFAHTLNSPPRAARLRRAGWRARRTLRPHTRCSWSCSSPQPTSHHTPCAGGDGRASGPCPMPLARGAWAWAWARRGGRSVGVARPDRRRRGRGGGWALGGVQTRDCTPLQFISTYIN